VTCCNFIAVFFHNWALLETLLSWENIWFILNTWRSCIWTITVKHLQAACSSPATLKPPTACSTPPVWYQSSNTGILETLACYANRHKASLCIPAHCLQTHCCPCQETCMTRQPQQHFKKHVYQYLLLAIMNMKSIAIPFALLFPIIPTYVFTVCKCTK